MADRPLVRLFWRVLDRLDYWLTQARLWLVDAVYDPEPEMAADQHGIGRGDLTGVLDETRV